VGIVKVKIELSKCVYFVEGEGVNQVKKPLKPFEGG